MIKCLLIIMHIFLSSCADHPGTTKVIISGISTDDDYPIYFNGFNGSNRYVSEFVSSDKEYQWDLPNGKWTFYGLKHVSAASGVSAKCIYHEEELSGGTMEVKLELSAANCENQDLNNTDALEINSTSNLPKLRIISCGAAISSGQIHDDCLHYQGSNTGIAKSASITFVASALGHPDNEDLTHEEVSMPAVGECFAVDSTSLHGIISTTVRVPIQAGLRHQIPWKMKVHLFNSANCQGEEQDYSFKSSIDQLDEILSLDANRSDVNRPSATSSKYFLYVQDENRLDLFLLNE